MTSLKLSLRMCQRAIVSLRRSYCTVSPRNVLKLRERGVIQSVFPATHVHELEKQLGQPLTVYCGFDPTADSLHLGNLLAVIALLHCQRAGHSPICVVGGATAKIGDPSGRTKDRDPLGAEVVEKNITSISESLERIFANHQQYFWKNQSRDLPRVKILNNNDWYCKQSVVDFLSTLGRKFRIGSMMHRESVRTKLESDEGLSLTEFTYQVFQACDWLHLYENYNCTVQVGGSDQLGNIISGYEFITKIHKRLFFGLMVPLLTTSSGEKLGKSANNSMWLNPDKTTPFQLYQYFINLPDSNVENYLRLFTFLTKQEIRDCLSDMREKPELRRSQKTLAEEIVKLVHGEVGLEQAIRWTDVFYHHRTESLAILTDLEVKVLFGNFPITTLPLSPGLMLVNICLRINVFKSRAEAEQKIHSGQVKVNFRQERNPEVVFREMEHILPNDITLITLGKKSHHVVKWVS
ncbi:tyrosine--tRNA ligase, mitochondrial-like [Ostrea edulis]|uniref:tyrosine--tRNA ligase, mitochondrial-like n=1 Tax=Ostrea edulis TaxID=37623 RepID=UPI0024AE8DFD|nr:tyrosine--tRNA ligase, mitochondrial-like [Ostrea edulis]XP_048760257.2 tyrosine--tRNA ligase, mitochondrial-like [Ostrea edulis]